MNLYAKLQEREALGKPLRIGVIGAGKFAAMYIAQARNGNDICIPEAARGLRDRFHLSE